MTDQSEKSSSYFHKLLINKTFHRLLIGIIDILIIFFIVESGALPKKYNIYVGQKSPYDIVAPREVIDEIKTNKAREDAVAAVRPILVRREEVAFSAKEKLNEFFNILNITKNSIEKSLINKDITPKSPNYNEMRNAEIEAALPSVLQRINALSFPLSADQVKTILLMEDKEVTGFQEVNTNFITQVFKNDITVGNLDKTIKESKDEYGAQNLSKDLKDIGVSIISVIIKPNLEEDRERTEKEKEAAKNNTKLEQKIEKGTRIVMTGEILTEAQYKVLEQLNLLKTSSKIDYGFVFGILIILITLIVLLVKYMDRYSNDVLNSRNDLILLSLIVIITLAIARVSVAYDFSVFIIPISIAAMLISILFEVKLAIIFNAVITVLISFITHGDIQFVYLSLMSGTVSSFTVSKADQRSKLALAGLIVSAANMLIIISLGMMNKQDGWTILQESGIGLINGIVSVVFTIGTLPFWESTFNIITPLKLLELSNPNQPLLKRLLMEAPGTYHHSLMVGNLVEAAAEDIGGNALLARVGAYYHDVGKLRRPYFFMENQFNDNPHDRMTANLSTLVITSHTKDGEELAIRHKLPMAIRELIRQHHGTTLVAYFYHKAKKNDKADAVKMENFRYEGPKPTSKEAAVIMLADSVEAAVRSMVDRTEGKIEGLVRKLIKEKLDDGQLDMCDLTLKDLDLIAKGFMRVFSGYFHEREEYPEVRVKGAQIAENNIDLSDLDIKEETENQQQKNAEVKELDGSYN